ncbi:lipoyl(octanoyl) transferase LipB [Aliikangiella sp. IMCC44359]|uniref:lipoyl(octanoyl) transferase LipB n=1 Tax=Aliikangiella sp. IMCC44359 TaxID=3459125 RepID=UPI00403B1F6B
MSDFSKETPLHDRLIVRQLGRHEYTSVWHAMQVFTDKRNDATIDELWLVEHDPVFTQGQAGKAEHILAPGDIPVVQVDRGGQVTYHGPGQQVAYFLINLRRKKLGVRELVTAIENAVVQLLKLYNIDSAPKADAPGVYVNNEKICSLGLRIRKGCSFHGLALNIAMDKTPFSRINPCGYAGMQVTQVSELGGPSDLSQIADNMVKAIMNSLSYQHVEWADKNQIDFEKSQ